MSDNADLTIGVRAQTDQASFENARKALRGIGDASATTLAQIDRSKALDNAAKDFAQMAIAENDAAKAAANLAEEFTKLGASEAEIEKVTRAIDKEIEAIQRADAASSAKAAKDLERAEIDAHKENDRRNAPSGGDSDSDLGSSAGDAESGLRALTGVIGAINPAAGQAVGGIAEILGAVEGLGRLPDAAQGIAQSLGLVKVAQEASAAAATGAAAAETTQAVATGGLALASGGATLSVGALLLALAPIAAIGLVVAAGVAAVGLALGELNRQSQEAADGIRRRFDAQKEADELARSGATTEEAIQKRIDLENEAADAIDRANDAQAEKDATYANDVRINGKLAADLRLNNAVYKEYDEIIKENRDAAQEASASVDGLNKKLNEGSFAANDAAAKATDSAKAQEKASDESARAQEKAAADAQRAQEKHAAEEKSAAEKIQREAEQQAQKVRDAQDSISKSTENYTNKLVDMARQSSQKMADIQQGAQDKSADTSLKYYRDTIKLADDARAAEIDAQRKSTQGELQADKEANRKLQDLREDAIASEQDALNSRNFLAAAKVRDGLEKSSKATVTEAERARDDRQTAAEIEAQDRYIELTKARTERTDALKQERFDNKTALDRQGRDARIAQDRQRDEAQIAYSRESAEKQAHLNELLGIDQAYYAQRTSMAQAAANGGSTQAGIGSGSAPVSSGASGLGGFTPGSFGGLHPITTNTSRSTVNNVTIHTDSDQRILRILTETGVIRDA